MSVVQGVSHKRLYWAGAALASLSAHAALMFALRPLTVGETSQAAGPQSVLSVSLPGVLGNAAVTGETKTATTEPVTAKQAKAAEKRSVLPVRDAAHVRSTDANTAPRSLVRDAAPARRVDASAVTTRAEPPPIAVPVAPSPDPDFAAPAKTDAKVATLQRAPASDPKTPPVTKPPQIRERPPKPTKTVEPKRTTTVKEPAPPKREARRKPKLRRSGGRAGGKSQGAAGHRRSGNNGRRTASAGAMRSYGALVRARVLANRPGGGAERGRAVISFGIAASGSLRYARVARSSGNAFLDRSSLSAVRRAAPFPRPPRGASSTQLRFSISFTFQ